MGLEIAELYATAAEVHSVRQGDSRGNFVDNGLALS